ncbi:MAG: site-2 protease family protein [Candidatus Omnitrophica bacterium]|nr:site-2 protease family protein [Candidatus Omnitrophota bacterium]
MSFIQNLPAFFIALTVHEYAHGFVAHKLGDNTAKHMGRLTLNPLAHIDLFGTILLPLTLIIYNAPIVIGWAKPVPVNFYNLRNPKKGIIWVGLAGPAANFICGFFVFLIMNSGWVTNQVFDQFLRSLFLINLILGCFNLIPIAPLDGSRIIMGLLPDKLVGPYTKFSSWLGILIMLGITLILLFRRIF